MKPEQKKLSIVIPTFNEVKNRGFLPQILEALIPLKDTEIIIVDGGSTDKTEELWKKMTQNLGKRKSDSLLFVPFANSNRAQRLNLGIQKSSGKIIFLHHPRSFSPKKSFEHLIWISEKKEFWGGFKHKFQDLRASPYTDGEFPKSKTQKKSKIVPQKSASVLRDKMLKFTSFYSNYIRGCKTIYLDHGIFAPKRYFEIIGKIPETPIFEDTELSKKLFKKFGRPQILYSEISETSAIRFLKNGVLKQSFQNQILKIKYFFPKIFCAQEMDKIYEKNIDLNQQYTKK